MVVNEDEEKAYADVAGKDRVLVLPESNRGLVYARNWIKDHSIAEGAERHWQFDDDISRMVRCHKGYRITMSSKDAIACAEEFVNRYENVALASFNSEFFIPMRHGLTSTTIPPFYLNARCYTVFLVLNSMPNRWRRKYNEDTDMTLQVLASGWCTVLFNAFAIKTPRTMTAAGGQDGVYAGDGRLKMAREVERLWPGVVTVKRHFKRPQHHVSGMWKKFDTPLRLKAGLTREEIAKRGSKWSLVEVAPVKSRNLQEFQKQMEQEQ